jgi:AbrB family looped-hinge helix DNA binding protein
MALTKVGPKFQVTIPKATRVVAGIKVGDIVEATATPRGILLKPKLVVDRDLGLEERLTASETAVKAGRVSRPYRSARVLVRDALRAGKKGYIEAKDEERTGRLKGPFDAKLAAAHLAKVSKKRRKR